MKKFGPYQKMAVPLHRFSPQNRGEGNSKTSSLTCLQHTIDVVQENRDKTIVPVNSEHSTTQ